MKKLNCGKRTGLFMAVMLIAFCLTGCALKQHGAPGAPGEENPAAIQSVGQEPAAALGQSEDNAAGAAADNDNAAGANPDTTTQTELPETPADWDKILTLGAVADSMTPAVEQGIVNFNQNNANCQIEIVEYGTEGSMEDIDRLNVDIASGNAPDIILLPWGISPGHYIEKGAFADLNPWLAGDDSLKREDLQENILAAYETDGQLFRIPIAYNIDTLFARTSLVDGQTSWNIDGLINFVDRGQDDNIFFNDSKSAVLEMCLRANGDWLVDWSTGNFKREEFMRLLEFANRFTTDSQYVSAADRDREIMESRVQLYELVGGFYALQMAETLFGEAVTAIGYPSENGSGNIISSWSELAVSDSCVAKQEAWQFISSMLSAEFQESSIMENNTEAFPLRRSGLEALFGKMLALETEPLYIGMVMISPPTAEEVEFIRELIEGADQIRAMDGAVSKIIMEEAGLYFNGDKSVDEVAATTENRIQIYISENM